MTATVFGPQAAYWSLEGEVAEAKWSPQSLVHSLPTGA